KGNPILELTDIIREEIFGNHNVFRILSIMIENRGVKENIGYDFLHYSKLNEHIKNCDFSKTRLVAYRNKTIDFFNYQIRNFLLNYPDKEIVTGDIVCMTDNFYKEVSGIITYVLHNSSVFELDRIYTKVDSQIIVGKAYTVD